jgi:hypothetical protein
LTKTLKGMKIKNNIDVKYHLLVQIWLKIDHNIHINLKLPF